MSRATPLPTPTPTCTYSHHVECEPAAHTHTHLYVQPRLNFVQFRYEFDTRLGQHFFLIALLRMGEAEALECKAGGHTGFQLGRLEGQGAGIPL